MIILFALLVVFVCYTYFGYPLVLFFLSIGKKNKEEAGRADAGEMPRVSLLIAAFNEEGIISKKIENSLALEYPPEKLEIIVVSDGSSDGTDDIVRRYIDRGVLLYRVEGRLGKTIARNKAVERASGDILICSDANAMYESKAIYKMVSKFNNPSVGLVCGNLRLVDANDRENLYWRYEKWIKKLEDRFHSIIGANGSIYAIRRNLYRELPAEVDDDFVEPLLVYIAGFRAIYDATAVSTEMDISEGYASIEFEAKKRVVMRGLQSAQYIAGKIIDKNLHPAILFELVSHKICKWLIPFALCALFVMNLFLLHSSLFMAFLLLQVGFYILALLGIFTGQHAFKIPAFFTVTNIAVMAAILEFIVGRRSLIWNRSRGNDES